MCRFISLLFCSFVFLSCVAPAPFEEYALAQAALEGARQAKAKQHSPRYYQMAQSYFRQAQIYFKNKNFDKSLQYFRKSKDMAEKAERVSATQMSGDELY